MQLQVKKNLLFSIAKANCMLEATELESYSMILGNPRDYANASEKDISCLA